PDQRGRLPTASAALRLVWKPAPVSIGSPETSDPTGGHEMPEHSIGTREEWQAARDELAKLEAEHGKQNEEIKRKRLELPWAPVEKENELEPAARKNAL